MKFYSAMRGFAWNAVFLSGLMQKKILEAEEIGVRNIHCLNKKSLDAMSIEFKWKLAAKYLNYGGLVCEADAVKICSKSQSWLRRKVDSGKITSVRIDGKRFIALPSLICWVTENETMKTFGEFELFIYNTAKRELCFWEDIITKNKKKPTEGEGE